MLNKVAKDSHRTYSSPSWIACRFPRLIWITTLWYNIEIKGLLTLSSKILSVSLLHRKLLLFMYHFTFNMTCIYYIVTLKVWYSFCKWSYLLHVSNIIHFHLVLFSFHILELFPSPKLTCFSCLSLLVFVWRALSKQNVFDMPNLYYARSLLLQKKFHNVHEWSLPIRNEHYWCIRWICAKALLVMATNCF